METYMLAELVMKQNGIATKLVFTSAQLVIVTDAGFKLWYIEVDGITQSDLLRAFGQSENIRVELTGVTSGGRAFEAAGYFHPNEAHHAAAIRGDGELPGF